MLGWALGGGFFGRIGDRLGRAPGAEPHRPDLCRLYRAVFLRADLVAPADLPVPGCAGHRRRMGGGRVVALGNLAAPVAALDRRGAPDRRERRHPRRSLANFILAAAPPRCLFLVGVLPALLVFWIRRAVPETEEWRAAKARPATTSRGIGRPVPRGGAGHHPPGGAGLLACRSRPMGVHVWHQQHLRNLPDVLDWTSGEKNKLASDGDVSGHVASILGNFFAGLAGAPDRVSRHHCRHVPDVFLRHAGRLLPPARPRRPALSGSR